MPMACTISATSCGPICSTSSPVCVCVRAVWCCVHVARRQLGTACFTLVGSKHTHTCACTQLQLQTHTHTHTLTACVAHTPTHPSTHQHTSMQ
jgi:ABC-type nickel/cobalt efflux system permease component RcnA